MVYVLLALMVLAWMVRGIEQAVLWSRLGDKAFKWNEHFLFLISRGLYIAIVIVATQVSWFAGASAAGCSILLFPIVHNGIYYVARNMIADTNMKVRSYPDGWRSEPSHGSTAHLNFSWKTRYMLAIGGGIMLIFMIFGL